MTTTQVEVDARGRLSLPKSLRGEGPTRYLASVLPGGDLLLRKAVVVPEMEIKLLRNQEFEDAFTAMESYFAENPEG